MSTSAASKVHYAGMVSALTTGGSGFKKHIAVALLQPENLSKEKFEKSLEGIKPNDVAKEFFLAIEAYNKHHIKKVSAFLPKDQKPVSLVLAYLANKGKLYKEELFHALLEVSKEENSSEEFIKLADALASISDIVNNGASLSSYYAREHMED